MKLNQLTPSRVWQTARDGPHWRLHPFRCWNQIGTPSAPKKNGCSSPSCGAHSALPCSWGMIGIARPSWPLLASPESVLYKPELFGCSEWMADGVNRWIEVLWKAQALAIHLVNPNQDWEGSVIGPFYGPETGERLQKLTKWNELNKMMQLTVWPFAACNSKSEK